MAPREIKFSELKRQCVCDSDKLQGNKYIIGNKVHTWVGIGMVEEKTTPDPDTMITVVD